MSIDNYTAIKVIGKGSYGEVWLVRHKKDRKQYVWKKLQLQNASKKERKAAEQEAQLLSKLKHPNIVSYKDSFEQGKHLYITMGYCEGGDLYGRLKQQKAALLEERQVVEWFVQIAMALQYLHNMNILHRDLKTQNIFLTKSKIIKVGDLGIARVLNSSSAMATTLIGTPYYMSPELFSNKPYNHKSDVWALGCCVYEMATLKHAFNAKDMNSLMYKIVRGKMPSMPKMYSSQLIDLIKAMLHQNPDKRPTVNRLLRDPYVKKNIAIFLEGTNKSRKSGSSNSSRPSSAEGSRRSNQSRQSQQVNVEKSVKVAAPPPIVKKVVEPAPPPYEKEKLEPLHIGPELEPISEEPVQCNLSGSGSSQKSSAHKKESVLTQAADSIKLARNKKRPDRGKWQPPAPVIVDIDLFDEPPCPVEPQSNAPTASNKLERPSTPPSGLQPSSQATKSEKAAISVSAAKSPTDLVDVKYEDLERLKPKLSKTESPDRNSSSRSSKASSISSHRKSSSSDSGSSKESLASSANSQKSVRHHAKPVDRQRPLPPRPSSAGQPIISEQVPEKSRQRVRVESSKQSAPTGVNGLCNDKHRVDNTDSHQPKLTSSAPNLSARERRRKVKMETETPRTNRSVVIEKRRRPYSAREAERLVARPKPTRRSSESSLNDLDKPSPNRHPQQSAWQNQDNISPPDSDRSDYNLQNKILKEIRDLTGENGERRHERRLPKPPCVPEDISVEEERELEELEMARNEEDMECLITLMNTTLGRGQKLVIPDVVEEDEGLVIEMPSATYNQPKEDLEENLDDSAEQTLVPIETEYNQTLVMKSTLKPSAGVKTMTTTGRLYERIAILRKDCIQTLGVKKLTKAYEILDKFEADELEPHLIDLLGREDYDTFAGKIWQLKFCEEAAFGLF